MAKTLFIFILVLLAVVAEAQSPSPSPSASPTSTPANALIPTKDENNQQLQPNLANKRSIIAKLKSIQSKQTNLIDEIDNKIKGQLKDTQEVKVAGDAVTSELRINRLQETMETLEKKRREAIERSQFIDRLIFAVDTKWNANSLKVFMEQTLLDIASAEMNQTDSKTPSNLWKFSTYLSMAVRELPEPREDIISFIDNYMDYSSVTDPKPPTAFAQARSYTNGIASQAAKVTKQEDLGDGVERKVRTLKHEEPPAIIQGTTSAPLEPMLPAKIPPSAANPDLKNSAK